MLGNIKNMKDKTIIVAMSGGVDSSTTAYEIKKEGYNVIGATLQMGRSCDKIAIQDAKQVCEKLNIEHFVIDVKNDFHDKILNYFYDDYINGRTPNPCAKCNREVKFKAIIDFMKEKNADFIATGHYAKIVNNNGNYELHKSFDKLKDQSYFLSTLKYEDLQSIKFPLQAINKINVREIANEINLHVANKTDSQDACFIETNYKDFLHKYFNIQNKKGFIINTKKQIIGEHNGIFNFTLGQRKGLGVSDANALYVIDLDPINNLVIVGSEEDLLNNKLQLNQLNILNNIIYNENEEFLFKLRSTHKGEHGKIIIKANSNAEITLNNNVRAITKGQLCAIYKNDLVVGSGWII